MLDGLELFGMGYSWGGFESLVDPVRLLDLPHGDRRGTRAARPCASRSGSRTSTISRPISTPASPGCAEGASGLAGQIWASSLSPAELQAAAWAAAPCAFLRAP